MWLEFLAQELLLFPQWKRSMAILYRSVGRSVSRAAYVADGKMAKLSLKQSSLHRVLSISLEPDVGCHLGETDAIEMDQALSPGDKILLSVESLTNNESFTPQVRRVSLVELQRGLQLELKLPDVPDYAHLGLFLCKDSKGRHSCLGKAAIDPADIVIANIRGAAGNTFVPPDRIYFFAYLLLDKNGNLTIPSQSQWQDEPFQAMAQELSKDVPRGNRPESILRALFLARQISLALSPASVTVSSSSLHVTLG